MPKIIDIPHSISLDDVLLTQDRAAQKEAVARACEHVHGLCDDLLAPALVYEILPIKLESEESVRINDVVLNTGPHTRDMLAHAQNAIVSVVTIGRALEEKTRDLNANGDLLHAYILDCVGVLALWKIGEYGTGLAEAGARERGWGVSPRLAPGSLSGWPVEDQTQLSCLVDIASIGVELGSGIFRPYKSASALVGLGPGYTDQTVGLVCHLCDRRNDCMGLRMRKARCGDA